MGKINFYHKYKFIVKDEKKVKYRFLDDPQFDDFTSNVLGLGDISVPSTQVEAIASIFDLSGFTNFCNQTDPHIAVPKFLSKFLNMLFDGIKHNFVVKVKPDGKALWSELPFMAKFLGDGVLFLWNTESMSGEEICNILWLLKQICEDYRKDFYPYIKSLVVNPPKTLRCTIARGTVCSVGNGEDYVGPCINIASRLQRLGSLTFCFNPRGFDIEEYMDKKVMREFLKKSFLIRGIGKELVVVLKKEFDDLSNEEKKVSVNLDLF